MARGDYHFSTRNQMNAHVFVDRSDSSSWPGNMNYIEQAVFSDVNQVAVSDTHIFSPRLVTETTVSYLTSRSGGGAVTQIAPRDQGVNVNVGNDGRGMSYSISGGINLSYPGINTQDYTSWQVKNTTTYNVGNHTLKWGYEFIRPVFEFNLALTRSANFQGTRTGDPTADFMIGAFENATMEFGIADHSPSTVKHQLFVADSYRVHPRLTLDYGLRYEPFIPFDQKGGRHTTWVPGVQSTVVPDAPAGILFPGDPGLPSRLTNSDLNNFAPRVGAAWDVTGTAKTVVRGGYGIFYQQINGETTHAAEAPWRGTTQLRQGRIEDPFGSLGQTEPPPESPGRFGCSPISAFPGLQCSQYPVPIRTVYTDQNLRTSYTHHFSTSIQRQLGAHMAVEASYIGKIGRKLVGHNYFNAAPFINSPITGQPPTLQNVEQRVPFSPGIISAQSRVLGNFFRSDVPQPAVARRSTDGAHLLDLGLVCALEELDEPAGEYARVDQQHSQSVRSGFALGTVVPRSAARRGSVVGLEPAPHVLEFVPRHDSERMDAHRTAPHPIGHSAGLHHGFRRRPERHPAAQRPVRAPRSGHDGGRRPQESLEHGGHGGDVLQHCGIRAGEPGASRDLWRRRARIDLRAR